MKSRVELLTKWRDLQIRMNFAKQAAKYCIDNRNVSVNRHKLNYWLEEIDKLYLELDELDKISLRTE